MANWERSDRFDEWQGCLGCAHYRYGKCAAYPRRIPINIMSGEVDHMIPRPGQVEGILFEPMDIDWWRETGERRALPTTNIPQPVGTQSTRVNR